MVTRTFREQITDSAYTKVGDNVTMFSVVESAVGEVRVVVVDVGDTAPAVAETQYIDFDGFYTRNADAVDIYMLSPDGTTYVQGERT